MPSDLENLPANLHAVLVTFTWGNSSVTRYCRFNDTNLVIGSDTFVSEGSVKVVFEQALGGGTTDQSCSLSISTKVAPIATLCLPSPHAKVDVLIEEIIPYTAAISGPDTSSRRTIFAGRVSKVSVKPNGTDGVATLKIVGPKARLVATLGFQALTTCPWIFGSPQCGFDLAAATLTSTISALAVGDVPNRITVAPVGGDFQNPRWNRGHIVVDKLAIVIRKCYNDGVITFELRDIPPGSWLGAACTLVPGCDKQVPTCRIHQRQESFGGCGLAMPDRNPVFQE